MLVDMTNYSAALVTLAYVVSRHSL